MGYNSVFEEAFLIVDTVVPEFVFVAHFEIVWVYFVVLVQLVGLGSELDEFAVLGQSSELVWAELKC